jgi:hypothetical protein
MVLIDKLNHFYAKQAHLRDAKIAYLGSVTSIPDA